MPSPYGVTPTGFSVKTLAEQLAEIELEEQAVFGSGVVFDSQSPLGQINGVFSDAIAEIWEMAQALYGSFDVDQASGPRLDAIGKLRRVTRLTGQSDAEYRLAISQSGYGDTKTRQLRNKLLTVDGVTRVQIVENTQPRAMANGLDPHSIAVIVEGGNDSDVGTVIWENTVPGIGLHGRNYVQVNSDGYCQTVNFVRPVGVQMNIEIDLSIHLNQCNCVPEDVSLIIAKLREELSGTCGLQAGSLVTPALIEQIVAQNNGILVEEIRMSRDGTIPEYQNVAFKLEELPVIDPANIVVNYVVYDGPNTTQGTIGLSLTRGQIS